MLGDYTLNVTLEEWDRIHAISREARTQTSPEAYRKSELSKLLGEGIVNTMLGNNTKIRQVLKVKDGERLVRGEPYAERNPYYDDPDED